VQREDEFSHNIESLKDKIKDEEEAHVNKKFSFAFNK